MPAERILVKMVFGAHLYGTATARSDRDYKGVFLPSKRDILLGRIPNTYTSSTRGDSAKNTPQDCDTEFYSLHYFIRLACEGQTVALDMLHAPPALVLETSDIWQALVAERQRFYTKNLQSFVRYARRQASIYGVKGARLTAVNAVLDVLRAADPAGKLQDVWPQLPRQEYCAEAGVDPQGFPLYQVCGKSFQASVSLNYMIPILEKFAREYGHRAQLAAENQNIDWKAIFHALRVALQVKELLTSATITFPLREAAWLTQVKTGSLDYLTEVAPVLEALMDEVEHLIHTSSLPEQADVQYWDDFLCHTLEREVFA